MKKNRKKYDTAFKLEAIRLVIDEARVARFQKLNAIWISAGEHLLAG